MPGKEIILKEFIGERKNSTPKIFQNANERWHKEGLNQKERMKRIKKMRHFIETRKKLVGGIERIEEDLNHIEKEVPGAKGISASR